ncbi:hypothetical protein C8R45DRAFT_1107065 [Mycena sanguinolenta]|nr:hypothetical protein C8R45DRAFT_1107065 [Mycena sanguinolenta]
MVSSSVLLSGRTSLTRLPQTTSSRTTASTSSKTSAAAPPPTSPRRLFLVRLPPLLVVFLTLAFVSVVLYYFFDRYLTFAHHLASKSPRHGVPEAVHPGGDLALDVPAWWAVPLTGVLFFAFGRDDTQEGEGEGGAERLRDFVPWFPNSKTASTSMTDAEDTSTTYSKPEFTLVLPFVVQHDLSLQLVLLIAFRPAPPSRARAQTRRKQHGLMPPRPRLPFFAHSCIIMGIIRVSLPPFHTNFHVQIDAVPARSLGSHLVD